MPGCIYLGHAKALLIWTKHISQGLFNSSSPPNTELQYSQAERQRHWKMLSLSSCWCPAVRGHPAHVGSWPIVLINQVAEIDIDLLCGLLFSAEINRGSGEILGTICEPITGTTSICCGSHSVLIWQLHSWSRAREGRGFQFLWWLTNIVGEHDPLQLWQI